MKHTNVEEVLNMAEEERFIAYTIWARQRKWIDHVLREELG